MEHDLERRPIIRDGSLIIWPEYDTTDTLTAVHFEHNSDTLTADTRIPAAQAKTILKHLRRELPRTKNTPATTNPTGEPITVTAALNADSYPTYTVTTTMHNGPAGGAAQHTHHLTLFEARELADRLDEFLHRPRINAYRHTPDND